MTVTAEFLLELAIWSGMAGVILLLVVIAAADVAVERTAAAWRGLTFVLLVGGAAVLMSGLPQTLWPQLDGRLMLVLKVGSGPLSGALALTYLGTWVGLALDDRLIRWVVAGGSALMVLSALVLVGLAVSLSDASAAGKLLLASGLASAVGVVFAAVVAVRAATLGDALARWMTAACLCLALMVSGLYAKGIDSGSFNLWLWTLTALSTVGYFLVAIALTLQRNRMLRRLQRQARGATQDDWGVELPRGSQLLSKVDDALWRSARVGRECIVAAVSIPNLYELGQVAGHGVDAQILSVLAARIRRIAGFRNVVGLYHPRCFVLVFSAVQDPKRGELVAAQLRESLCRVVELRYGRERHVFEPQIGIGAVRVSASGGDPLALMNRAEQLALAAGSHAQGIMIQSFQTGQVAAS